MNNTDYRNIGPIVKHHILETTDSNSSFLSSLRGIGWGPAVPKRLLSLTWHLCSRTLASIGGIGWGPAVPNGYFL